MSEAFILPTIVVDFLREAGQDVGQVQDGDGVLVYDSENGVLLRRQMDEIVVQEFSRGRMGRVLLRTREGEAVSRYVVLAFGSAWRSRAGLPFLYTMQAPEHIPDGYVLQKTAPRRFSVLWSEAGRACRAEELDTGFVTEFVRALPHPLPVVIASMKDPGGLPVFPQTP